MTKRLLVYQKQSGTQRLTPAQRRRASHKARRGVRDYRARVVVDLEMATKE